MSSRPYMRHQYRNNYANANRNDECHSTNCKPSAIAHDFSKPQPQCNAPTTYVNEASTSAGEVTRQRVVEKSDRSSKRMSPYSDEDCNPLSGLARERVAAKSGRMSRSMCGDSLGAKKYKSSPPYVCHIDADSTGDCYQSSRVHKSATPSNNNSLPPVVVIPLRYHLHTPKRSCSDDHPSGSTPLRSCLRKDSNSSRYSDDSQGGFTPICSTGIRYNSPTYCNDTMGAIGALRSCLRNSSNTSARLYDDSQSDINRLLKKPLSKSSLSKSSLRKLPQCSSPPRSHELLSPSLLSPSLLGLPLRSKLSSPILSSPLLSTRNPVSRSPASCSPTSRSSIFRSPTPRSPSARSPPPHDNVFHSPPTPSTPRFHNDNQAASPRFGKSNLHDGGSAENQNAFLNTSSPDDTTKVSKSRLDNLRTQYEKQILTLQEELEFERKEKMENAKCRIEYDQITSDLRKILDKEQQMDFDCVISQLKRAHKKELEQLEDTLKYDKSLEILALKTSMGAIYESKNKMEKDASEKGLGQCMEHHQLELTNMNRSLVDAGRQRKIRSKQDDCENSLQDRLWSALSPYIRSISFQWQNKFWPICSVIVLLVAILFYYLLLPARVTVTPETERDSPQKTCNSWALFPCDSNNE